MFIDARQVPNDARIDADVCIIGAGAAGITLARELVGTSMRVVLLESGGLEPDPETQSLYEGRNIGFRYFDLDRLRLRYFGGTTNHWTGSCRPLDPLDFEARPWIPDSGWPIGRAELDPFYARAHTVCQLGPYDYAPESRETKDGPRLPLNGDAVVTAIHYRSPPTRFGQVYRQAIEGAANIQTYLFANVIDIGTSENAKTATHVGVATLANNSFRVAARVFVLATGALENARLLLASSKVQSTGLGNQYDLVGRFFMEHLNSEASLFLLSNQNVRLERYLPTATSAAPGSTGEAVAFLHLSPAAQRKERLLNARALFRPGRAWPGVLATSEGLRGLASNQRPAVTGAAETFMKHVHDVIVDIDNVAVASYLRLFRYPRVFNVIYQIEQVPNRDSQVTLAPERDRLGMPRIQLNWRFTDLERQTLHRFSRMVAEEFGKAGIGRIRMMPDDPKTGWPSIERPLQGTWHQMGTTRMHDDPRHGIVDRDCRMHSTSNVFVAGSSVFTTGGCSNPTLTIVALALRLADHLKQRLR